jgi:multiple sugar transport system permease protein
MGLSGTTDLVRPVLIVYWGFSILQGLASCFFGYRLLRVVLGVQGFLLGAALGGSLAGLWGVGDSAAILLVLVGAAVGAAALALFYSVAVFTAGAAVAALLGLVVGSALSLDTNSVTIVLLSLAFLGGILALAIEKSALVIATAVIGAWSAVYGLLSLVLPREGGLGLLPDVRYFQEWRTESIVALALWLVLAAGGSAVQFLVTARGVTRQERGAHAAQRSFIRSVTTPMILYAGGLTLLPIIWALALMLFDYNPQRIGGPILGLGGDNPFVGLQHFSDMIFGVTKEASTFRISLVNTLIFSFIVLPLNLAITLPLAWLIESVKGRLKTLFRAIYFLPAITASVGVALMWGYLYDPQYGLFNTIIRGLGGTPVAWLSDPNARFLGISVAMWAVIVAYLWYDYGYNMVIFVAALQGIPKELKEAAMIDGASGWQVFWRITVPLLRPAILFVCVMTMISSFQVFDIFQVMTRHGDPNYQTRVLELDIYERAFSSTNPNMGWAAACAFVLLVVVGIVTLVQMRVLRTEWEY